MAVNKILSKIKSGARVIAQHVSIKFCANRNITFKESPVSGSQTFVRGLADATKPEGTTPNVSR